MKIQPIHLLGLALIIGCAVRFYQIGQIPAGFSWDEAAITYDAWGIADWHRDQYADFMPLVFKSFGDYKPPFMHYLLAAVFLITGVNELTIRLISAIAGVFLIIVVYFLTQEFFPDMKWVAPISALLVAISPWNVHMSRVGFEANVATVMIATAVLFWLWGRRRMFWYPISITVFAVSMYTYQSAKIVAPLLLLILFLYTYLVDAIELKKIFVGGIFFIALLIPLGFSIDDGGLGRGEQALIFFGQDGKVLINALVLKTLASNIANHVSLNFLIRGVQDNFRNIVPGFGILYVFDLFWLVSGILYAIVQKKKKSLLLFAWIIVGILPSILSTTSPHTIRSATIIAPLYVLVGLGIISSLQYVQKLRPKMVTTAILAVSSLYVISFYQFFSYYLTSYVSLSAKDFQYGYKQALTRAREELRSSKQLVVTDAYGQPYIYTLLYFRQTPEQFQSGSLANVKFIPVKWPSSEEETVFVATPDEIPVTDSHVVEVVRIPQTNEPVFVVARN